MLVDAAALDRMHQSPEATVLRVNCLIINAQFEPRVRCVQRDELYIDVVIKLQEQ